MIANEWKLPPRAEACAACGRAFEDGQTIQACIFITAGGFARTDLCSDCPQPDGPEPLGVWRTRFRLHEKEPRPRFDRTGLLGLLAQTADATDPPSQKFRFVLALLLWRKKALRLTGTTRTDGTECWHFIEARAEQSWDIPRPELTEDDLARLSAQLEALLRAEPVSSEVSAE